MGLAIAGAIALGYSNIFVTAPSPENLKTLFEFVCKGLEALEYKEHTDYDLVASTNAAFNKAVVRVNIFRHHRQVQKLFITFLMQRFEFRLFSTSCLNTMNTWDRLNWLSLMKPQQSPCQSCVQCWDPILSFSVPQSMDMKAQDAVCP